MTTGVSAETRACRRPGGGPGLLRNLYGSAFTAGLHAAVLVADIVSLLAAALAYSSSAQTPGDGSARACR